MPAVCELVQVSLRALFLSTFVAVVFTPPCAAIPAFARLYRTSCATCHLDFPKLNDFGKHSKTPGSNSRQRTRKC